jgi:SAM-dependent methyltransferase
MTTAYERAHDRVVGAGVRHYEALLRAHGPGPLGVGWNSQRAQLSRFENLARVLSGAPAGSTILDYGCGTGALLDWLRGQGFCGRYVGFDASETMIGHASAAHPHSVDATFTSDADGLSADYVLASGVLNLRFDVPDRDWHDYAVGLVDDLRRRAARGFAFNMLSSHSDSDRMRSDLHYADPAWWLDHCLQRYSRRVAILHDYDVWDFTVVVRLDPRPATPTR